MATRDITPIFHLPFELYLRAILIFVFENNQSSFLCGRYCGKFWAGKN